MDLLLFIDFFFNILYSLFYSVILIVQYALVLCGKVWSFLQRKIPFFRRFKSSGTWSSSSNQRKYGLEENITLPTTGKSTFILNVSGSDGGNIQKAPSSLFFSNVPLWNIYRQHSEGMGKVMFSHVSVVCLSVPGGGGTYLGWGGFYLPWLGGGGYLP